MYVYNVGGEDCYEDGEEESRPEFLCPFCAESFDIVGLCCHIDEEHAVESKNGVFVFPLFSCFFSHYGCILSCIDFSSLILSFY